MSAITRRVFVADATLGIAASALNLKAFAASEGTAPHFEVASIRPSPPGATVQQAHFSTLFGVTDRFDAEAVTVSDILDMLNGWQLGRVLGGPAWMRTDRYDIHAKAGAPISSEERKSAVMALLAERFQLVAHHETRDIPAAVLMAPKRPAGLKRAAGGETSSMRVDAHGDPVFAAVQMSAVTNYLAQMWHLPVVDQTGLTGTLDFSLAPSAIEPVRGQTWGDLVREAVVDFGFKVETKKVPLQVTVVDRCERPGEN
ncbi:TIGR03435 family protein [Terriglobus albidus]|uniref:TIGR03435 family protein n=1 Tax=Terriglobus albidus TaxID=1592106 RepID=UPI0021DFE03D|nr:TIGR03435 family protein [Terriglobus albidus]